MDSIKLLHTADWHLGREFHAVDLAPDHEQFFDFLEEVVVSEKIDAILMAGDIFDRALPPVASIELFRDRVDRLAELTRLILITGNHDSIHRMSLGSLFRDEIVLRSGVPGGDDPVMLDAGGFPVAVYPIPYLEPSLSAAALGTEDRTHRGVITAAVARATAHLDSLPTETRSVAIGHAFVTGGQISDSERQLVVGDAGQISAGLYERFDYTALGHLHRPQQITEKVVYSGSPVVYSFSEVGTPKSVSIVELFEDGAHTRTEIPTPVLLEVARVEGTLEKLLTGDEFAVNIDQRVEITVTDESRPRAPMDRLRTRFNHILSLRFSAELRGDGDSGSTYAQKVEGKTPIELATSFVEDVRGRGPDEEELALLEEAISQHGIAEQVS